MTKNDYILPMKKNRRILFLIYEGFELLDMSGPMAVFSATNSLSGQDIYQIEVISPDGGLVRSMSGAEVLSSPLGETIVSADDTLLVVGALKADLIRACADKVMKQWLRDAARTAERFGSICTGAFVLASAGLLSGKRATTHWSGCRQLETLYPSVSLQPDALYIVDGRVWTSAGVTTGIDMALAVIASDLGTPVMGQIARQLIVYAHRPGNQSQFSMLLGAQIAAAGVFSDVVARVQNQLENPIKVGDLAEIAGMSERTFYRKFTDHMGLTPSKFIESARLEKAKELLEANVAVKTVVHAVGFKSEAGFRSAFEAKYAVTPSLHRLIHGQN